MDKSDAVFDSMKMNRGDEDYLLDLDPRIDTSCQGCWSVSPLATVISSTLCLPLSVLACFGWFTVNEREHRAILSFGKYVGTVQSPGIHFLPTCCVEHRKISTATRTMNMKDLKVLDAKGNPVVVSAIVTFEPTSAKKARIDVQNPWPNPSWGLPGQMGVGVSYLELQAQAVLKQVTSQFPYEAAPGQPSLQTEGEHITAMMIQTLQRRVNNTGARIFSFDLVDLSYAPEIAQSMLVRQQAAALVDARKLIVKAAVDMTCSAVTSLEQKSGRPLSDHMRDQICSNLLTVVCSNEAVVPTMPLGSTSTTPVVVRR
jgi:regulator of protease activity HflC (stomatin/prohibitin superfamily)